MTLVANAFPGQSAFRRWRDSARLFFIGWLVGGAAARGAAPPPVVWPLAFPALPFEHLVLGHPRPVKGPDYPGLVLDGRGDGLVIPRNPLAGWPAFTVEILLRPAHGGPPEQRFLHIEDAAARRLTLELRVVDAASWALDGFLADGDQRRPLLDRTARQPLAQWAWAALSYDRTTMRIWVNGRLQAETPLRFGPMGPGQLALGVRLNRVGWFAGSLSAVRFTPRALDRTSLARVR